MLVVFKNPTLFFSKETKQQLDKSSWRLTKYVPKQLLDDDMTASFSTGAKRVD
jgi:hypothetical protein